MRLTHDRHNIKQSQQQQQKTHAHTLPTQPHTQTQVLACEMNTTDACVRATSVHNARTHVSYYANDVNHFIKNSKHTTNATYTHTFAFALRAECIANVQYVCMYSSMYSIVHMFVWGSRTYRSDLICMNNNLKTNNAPVLRTLCDCACV